MPLYEPIIGIKGFKIVSIREHGIIEVETKFLGEVTCPHCQSSDLRKKDSFLRRIKHHSIGNRTSVILIKSHKFKCKKCLRYFNQRFPGIRPRFQSTEPFREEIAQKHHWGFCRSEAAKRTETSSSTVERCYKDYLKTKDSHAQNGFAPRVLGIDEKHFTRKKGYMTTFADLKRKKVFDVTLGRSENSLKPYLERMRGKDNCRVIVMDLSETYRSIARKHFKNALIVADRFHVVKLINHHFLKTWSELDEVGRKNRGLLSLMRRHPENLKPEQVPKLQRYFEGRPDIGSIYDFKQLLMRLVKARIYSKKEAKRLIPEFLKAIEALKSSGLKHMVTLGETLERWQEEIVRMWRFSRTNSITEGLHNRMEEIIRRAYGFRNFENFRLRVKHYCS